MTVAHLHVTAAHISCDTPYNAAFVADLKNAFRFPDRRWDPDANVWLIGLRHEQALAMLCRRHYDDVQITRAAGPSAQRHAPKTPARSAYDVLYVKPDAPPVVVAAAYRALARLLHPDVNQSPEAHVRMQEINAAYEQVGAERW